MKTVATNGLFKPNASKQETKAQTTDSVARAIVSAEAKSRDSKTDRLRQLRLQREAEMPAVVAAPKKRAVKAKTAAK